MGKAATRLASAVLGLSGMLGCGTELAASGEACTRSSQCEPGLACIEGACSRDFDALREQGGEVPALMPDAGQQGSSPGDEDAGQ